MAKVLSIALLVAFLVGGSFSATLTRHKRQKAQPQARNDAAGSSSGQLPAGGPPGVPPPLGAPPGVPPPPGAAPRVPPPMGKPKVVSGNGDQAAQNGQDGSKTGVAGKPATSDSNTGNKPSVLDNKSGDEARPIDQKPVTEKPQA
uniref:Uncharacterized protein n=1 Tax=Plectus sambesii TaxID=2011161 RepID=A0A914WEV6_9BILA